ncbi:hypothetical protein QS257_07180 [Terrilactibacillus sp. S3-3]|nr:hypothetical protein QS257_07180 [Terrilactibacillus sp. S3-3]
MSSNWWQRFFNLEDDGDASDEKGDHSLVPDELRMNRKIVGRFEDSHRQVRVKMQHQYGRGSEDASIWQPRVRRSPSDVKARRLYGTERSCGKIACCTPGNGSRRISGKKEGPFSSYTSSISRFWL